MLYLEIKRKARKGHFCGACRRLILKKEVYTRVTCHRSTGEPVTLKYHPSCYEYESWLNEEGLTDGDEWFPLYQIVSENGTSVLCDAPDDVVERFR